MSFDAAKVRAPQRYIRDILTRMKHWWTILLAFGIPAFCQAPSKKSPDTWQKTKECADQAAKVIADWDDASVFWRNHYSPKYNRCFLLVSRQINVKDWIGTVFQNTLYDAFERSTLATSIAPPVPPEMASTCSMDDDAKADCKTSAVFIADHMKN